MAVAWFICPYKVIINPSGFPYYKRYPILHELIADISADGGQWGASEGFGNHCIAKVRASETTLANITALSGVIRLNKNKLNMSLSDLTNNQKKIIRDKLLDMGYTATELQNALGTDLGAVTLGDVLRFAASKRLTPKFDHDIGEMVFEATERPCKPIADTDNEVSDT